MISNKEEKKLIAEIDKKRTEYMKSKRYGKDICELFLQNFNFKGNTLDKLDVQKEIFPLVKQAIESYPEELQHRNIDLIKSSLDRSYYASQNATLLSHYTDQLINHNDDSFLVVPTGFKTKTGAHEVSCIIKKVGEEIQVEIFDKAGASPPERFEKSNENFNNYGKNYIVSNYFYKIDNTPDGINSMAKAIASGFTDRGFEPSDIKYQPLHFLSKIANSEYYGRNVTSSQYIQGNCLMKEVVASLKSVLSEKSSPGQLIFSTDKQGRTDSLNGILTEVACFRLEKMGYGTDISNYLREQYKMYCYLKDDRNKYPEDIKVMRKIENGKILNKHFTNSIPEFKRVASYNIEASFYNNKKKNLLSRFKKFIKLEGTKVRANQLTKEEITVIRSNVNDIRKNLEKDKEKINRNFNNIKEKALTMSMFIEPNVSRGSVRNSSVKSHNVRD
ncbi:MULTISPECIES: hypothetical protein [Enterococcus]|uniref:hypothetical protein n=1 Tax=Enterococcus TaxID=1350 RepID=UPI0003C55952|nr:hypothetical protein [Enterococcus mundtii]BAO08534.1 hypothetical protein EfmE980_0706 [Enterococcus mundtii QU 25]